MHQLLNQSRDTFEPVEEADTRLKEAIRANGNYLSKTLAANIFDSLFDRTTNVKFLADNGKQFKKAIANEEEPDRPLAFLEYSDFHGSQAYIIEILEYLQDTEMFDVFAEVDEKVPVFKPRLRIVDKQEKK